VREGRTIREIRAEVVQPCCPAVVNRTLATTYAGPSSPSIGSATQGDTLSCSSRSANNQRCIDCDRAVRSPAGSRLNRMSI
jgi:hypothetical protein